MAAVINYARQTENKQHVQVLVGPVLGRRHPRTKHSDGMPVHLETIQINKVAAGGVFITIPVEIYYSTGVHGVY